MYLWGPQGGSLKPDGCMHKPAGRKLLHNKEKIAS